MALVRRDSKVHWSVKESTLRSIFTPSREALITSVKALWKALCYFVFVFRDPVKAQDCDFLANVGLFARTMTQLEKRLNRDAAALYQRAFMFRWDKQICWNAVCVMWLLKRIWHPADGSTLYASSFISGQVCVSKPDSMWVFLLNSRLYISVCCISLAEFIVR